MAGLAALVDGLAGCLACGSTAVVGLAVGRGRIAPLELATGSGFPFAVSVTILTEGRSTVVLPSKDDVSEEEFANETWLAVESPEFWSGMLASVGEGGIMAGVPEPMWRMVASIGPGRNKPQGPAAATASRRKPTTGWTLGRSFLLARKKAPAEATWRNASSP